MSQSAEEIAEAGKEELEEVLRLMGLKYSVSVVQETKHGWTHWLVKYSIYVARHAHTGAQPIASYSCQPHCGSRTVDFREVLFKRVLGDLGRGLLDIVRKRRDDLHVHV